VTRRDCPALQIPPRLFTIPEKQQLVPNLRAPESRNDLEALMRVVNDQICASMGVPASVVFEGGRSVRACVGRSSF
jgi:hypothetical protein